MSANRRFSSNGDGEDTQAPLDIRKRQVTDALASRFQQLNALWDEAEKELRQFCLPVDVACCYKLIDEVDADGDPKGFQVQRHLGFVKSEGGWRICFCATDDRHPQYLQEWKPITDCALDLRVEAIPHIGKLREKVLEAAEECVLKLDKAIAEFRSMLSTW